MSSQKRVLVLGANGRTGRHVVARCLERGHAVSAFVRNPQTLAASEALARVITGDARTDDAALADAMRDQDVVISSLGAGDSFKPEGVIGESMPRIVRAMEEAGVRRLILTSAFGVGENFSRIPFLPRIFVSTLLRNIYADKLVGDNCVRSSKLDWTIVYPSGLTGKPGTGSYRHGETIPLRGFPTIAREDVAAFLAAQIDDRTYLKKFVMISSQ